MAGLGVRRLAVQVRTNGRRAHLGDGDAVEGEVQLTVPAAAQAEARRRCLTRLGPARSVVGGNAFGPEATDPGRSRRSGGGERTQPGRASRVGARAPTRSSISRSSGRMAGRSRTGPGCRGQARHGPARPARRASRSASHRPVERAGSRLVDAQVEQVPAQPLDVPGPLGDEVLAMVDEQPQLALGPSSVATGRSGSRRAAWATAYASIGSLLPGSRTERRTPAMSLGGTRTTDSPERRRSTSRRRERWRRLERSAARGTGLPSGGARDARRRSP